MIQYIILGACKYIPQELNPGNCNFPLRSGETCQPECSGHKLVPIGQKGGSVNLECKCDQNGCKIDYGFKCDNACFEPDSTLLPIGLKPKCDFPLPGGASCNFECTFGEFNSVQRAFGKCQCRNGDCSFSVPRATCAPTHSKYCRTDNALIESHPMARTYCATDSEQHNGSLSTYISAKNDQTCWLECLPGFVWRKTSVDDQIINVDLLVDSAKLPSNRSPPLTCSCLKKSLDCGLQVPSGSCVLAAFADYPL